MVNVRTLRASEHEALLDLLDGWELPDGWRGRDFFRRYLDDDPTFRDENVWVAERDGRLLSCVQIFPRRLLVAGRAVATGGIGSVYTRPEERAGGVASELLERAARAMRERGMPLSLLFASRFGFYGRLGWESWPGSRALLRVADGAADRSRDEKIERRPFDEKRDLAKLRRIHETYAESRRGTAVRDDALWQAVLRNGGNPGEEFVVAVRDGVPVAYARATVFSGFLVLTELGRDPDAAAELAALVRDLLTPRTPDPLALPARPSPALRAIGAAPPLLDAALADALRARGVVESSVPDLNAMLRVLDAPALAAAAGTQLRDGEDASALLRRVLPPDRFSYWPADRF